MTLTISIPEDSEEKLKQRAAASGQELATYVSQLVQLMAAAPTPIGELSGDLHKQFIDSGMSEDELSEELERAKHEMRAERRSRGVQ